MYFLNPCRKETIIKQCGHKKLNNVSVEMKHCINSYKYNINHSLLLNELVFYTLVSSLGIRFQASHYIKNAILHTSSSRNQRK